MSIEFRVGGRKVPANRFAAEMEKAIAKEARDGLVREIGKVRDPKTGERPKVRAKGRGLNDLSLEVEGSEAVIWSWSSPGLVDSHGLALASASRVVRSYSIGDR